MVPRSHLASAIAEKRASTRARQMLALDRTIQIEVCFTWDRNRVGAALTLVESAAPTFSPSPVPEGRGRHSLH